MGDIDVSRFRLVRMVEVSHDAVGSVVPGTMMSYRKEINLAFWNGIHFTLVKDQKRKLFHSHKTMAQGIGQDLIGRNHNADSEEHIIPDALRAPSINIVGAEQYLCPDCRKACRNDQVLLLTEGDCWSKKPNDLLGIHLSVSNIS